MSSPDSAHLRRWCGRWWLAIAPSALDSIPLQISLCQLVPRQLPTRTMALRFTDTHDLSHFEAGRPSRTVESEINLQADKAEEGGRTCGKDFAFRIRAQSFELSKQRLPLPCHLVRDRRTGWSRR